MTNQEAIKWIDGRLIELCCFDDTMSDARRKRRNEEYDALQLARAAIDKQIQYKTHIKETETPFARFDKSGILKRTMFRCPDCGKPLFVQNHFEYKSEDGSGFERWPAGSQTPHCPKCGQALKWKEE